MRSTITGSPPIVLPSAIGEAMLRFLEIFAGEQFAQVDRLAALVRQFDADGVAALNHRDAGRDRRHRAGDVVGKPDHARRFDARRRFELIERDDRAGAHVDDLAFDAEIVEDAFEEARVLLERILRNLGADRLLRLGQHRDRGHDPFAASAARIALSTRRPARRSWAPPRGWRTRGAAEGSVERLRRGAHRRRDRSKRRRRRAGPTMARARCEGLGAGARMGEEPRVSSSRGAPSGAARLSRRARHE